VAGAADDRASDEGVLRVERDERDVVTLTFDRPEVRNAFDGELMQALATTVADLGDDPSVRAVVLTGSGSVFSAGADLNWMVAVADYTFEQNVEDSRGFDRMLKAIHDFPAPVLARVNGHAIAGASGLLACVDIAVAVRGARFGFTETRLGLVPAMISAYVQPRIGLAAAHRYFLTGELFDADRALAMGLIHEVCEPDELDAVFGAVLDAVVAGGPSAQRATKRLIAAIDAAGGPEESERLRLETIAEARMGTEARDRVQAFLAR
jgi:methylglutaconyl-CoA hydratase